MLNVYGGQKGRLRVHSIMKKHLKSIALIGVVLLPVAAWVFYKPVRVLAPSLVWDIHCVTDKICIDNPEKFAQAKTLYMDALEFVESNVGRIESSPRIIFCSSQECYELFGFKNSAAQSLGTAGIVVSPRGWKYYYIRHEIIHHLQAEKMGMMSQWRSPAWFKEGMAYGLSEDPRKTLSDPFGMYREKFTQWYDSVGRENIWGAARTL